MTQKYAILELDSFSSANLLTVSSQNRAPLEMVHVVGELQGLQLEDFRKLGDEENASRGIAITLEGKLIGSAYEDIQHVRNSFEAFTHQHNLRFTKRQSDDIAIKFLNFSLIDIDVYILRGVPSEKQTPDVKEYFKEYFKNLRASRLAVLYGVQPQEGKLTLKENKLYLAQKEINLPFDFNEFIRCKHPLDITLEKLGNIQPTSITLRGINLRNNYVSIAGFRYSHIILYEPEKQRNFK